MLILPEEIIDIILFRHGGLMHPCALLIKKYMKEQGMVEWNHPVFSPTDIEAIEFFAQSGMTYIPADNNKYILHNLNVILRLDYQHLFDFF
jgi:hypothetical protein